MNVKLLFTTAAFAASSMVLFSCGESAPSGDSATVQEEQQAASSQGASYSVDTAASRVRFVGHGVGKNHPGVFKLSSGAVVVDNNLPTGGDFVINIQSMELEEKGGVFDEKLRPHMMSADFFEAEKFGTAKFEITGVQPYEANGTDTSVIEGANFRVSGNFTLKDVTKNITFPARIDISENSLSAKANFDIDRTQWQMSYGNDKSLGDKFINEKVNIELNLQAKK